MNFEYLEKLNTEDVLQMYFDTVSSYNTENIASCCCQTWSRNATGGSADSGGYDFWGPQSNCRSRCASKGWYCIGGYDGRSYWDCLPEFC